MLKNTGLCLIILSTFINYAWADERRFIGIWHKGSGSNIISKPMKRKAFMDKGSELAKQGLRLIDVETDLHNGQRFYTGVWVSGSGSNMFAGPMSRSDFSDQRKKFRDQGMRLMDFEVFRANGKQRFIGVWRSGTGPEILTRALSQKAFLKRGKKLTSEGKRLIDVEVTQRGNKTRYIGLYRAGTGSNLFTTPRPHRQFMKTRDEMVEKGMQLEDMEMLRINGEYQYVGVWKSGPGISRRSQSRNYKKFIAAGENFTRNKGLRLADVEIFMKEKRTNPPSTNPPQTGNATENFPPLPRYIELSGDRRIIVDFGLIIDGRPRITLPVDYLPTLPEIAGETIFPDNFCGLRVTRAESFFWHNQQNQVVEQHPYNKSEQVSDLGANIYLGGIDFTGPVGACLNFTDNWAFPHPLTASGENPLPNMKLIIELGQPPAPGSVSAQSSQIKFLNFNIQPGEALDPSELFSDEVFEKFENIAKMFEELSIDNGYCGIDQYIMEVCEESKAQCPVSENFDSPC